MSNCVTYPRGIDAIIFLFLIISLRTGVQSEADYSSSSSTPPPDEKDGNDRVVDPQPAPDVDQVQFQSEDIIETIGAGDVTKPDSEASIGTGISSGASELSNSKESSQYTTNRVTPAVGSADATLIPAPSMEQPNMIEKAPDLDIEKDRDRVTDNDVRYTDDQTEEKLLRDTQNINLKDSEIKETHASGRFQSDSVVKKIVVEGSNVDTEIEKPVVVEGKDGEHLLADAAEDGASDSSDSSAKQEEEEASSGTVVEVDAEVEADPLPDFAEWKKKQLEDEKELKKRIQDDENFMREWQEQQIVEDSTTVNVEPSKVAKEVQAPVPPKPKILKGETDIAEQACGF